MIEFQGVSKAFGSQSVLRSVCLIIPDGHLVLVRGRNGAGKSTLLRIMAGLLEPDAGTICIDGVPTVSPGRLTRGKVFLLSGDQNLMGDLYLREYIEIGLALWGKSPERLRSEVSRLLRVLGLGEFGDKHIRHLSGGERRKASLVLALAICPRVLLVDEALDALDSESRETAFAELSHARAAGCSTIVVTHHPSSPEAHHTLGLGVRDGGLHVELTS